MNNESIVLTKPAIDNRHHAKVKARKTLIFNILFYIAVTMIAIGMVVPFLWSIINSFASIDDINSMTIVWFPHTITTTHYERVFDKVNVLRGLANSLITTIAGLLTNLFFGTLAAYAFSKIRFSGHKIIFNIMMISMMIPGVITLVPTFYLLLRFPLVGGNNILGQGGIGFYNSFGAVILPGAIGVYGVFFMRQFFMGLPDDMMESARIDGASEFRIFISIYAPLVGPALITLGIFTFQGGWNNFMWPNIVLISPKVQLLTQLASTFNNPRAPEYGPMLALSIMMALPVIILFLFGQKYFIKGVATGSVKG